MKKVAIVGAGISGVVAGAHLGAAGVEFVVFERSGAAGGVWLYDERLPLEPTYPATKPSEGDVQGKSHWKDLRSDSSCDVDALSYAPPGPCYEGLSNNVSTKLMELKVNAWKPGTADFVNHRILKDYINDTALKTGVHARTLYRTRVETVCKSGHGWEVRTSTLARGKSSAGAGKVREQSWSVDAVVVASGHYHACHVPDIPGLAEWKSHWPGRVQHSKSYRHPEGFRNQNVLLIGAGVSSTDIARELGPLARSIYQVSRGGVFDLPATWLPPNATRIGAIESFEIPPTNEEEQITTADSDPVPRRVYLTNGSELTGIHRIVLCTGYQFSLPFLQPYHSDSTPASEADTTVLVTDGTQIHNLHKDIFYIPDPTLLFIGVPYFTATFTLFEFQAMAVAAVLAGKASLPPMEAMRQEYVQRVRQKGVGKLFHSLKGEEVEYVNGLVEWLNRDGAAVGAEVVEGHTRTWHAANVERLEKVRKMMRDKVLESDGSLIGGVKTAHIA